MYKHKIIIKSGAKPIKLRAYATSPEEKILIKEQIDELLDLDIIELSSSEWCSPCMLVDKKYGGKRLVIDARKLNSVTLPESFLPPTVTEVISSMYGCEIFTSLDLKKAYNQIPLDEE